MSRLTYNPARTTAAALQITHLDLQQRLGTCLNPLADMTAMGLEAAPVPDRPAAILVPLLRSAGHWHVLMTKRAEHLAHHAGQISFPGGKVDAADGTLVATALREADEEIALPASKVDILGGLDPVSSPVGFIVQPIVGIVAPRVRLQACPDEVARILILPLAELISPPRHRRCQR